MLTRPRSAVLLSLATSPHKIQVAGDVDYICKMLHFSFFPFAFNEPKMFSMKQADTVLFFSRNIGR